MTSEQRRWIPVHHRSCLVHPDDCEVVASAYLNVLQHGLVLHSSWKDPVHDQTPEPEHFAASPTGLWSADPLLRRSIELELISLTNGKGKGTNFCYLPEKDQLIIGNEDLYRFFADVVYGTPFLCIQPSGFMVLPEYALQTSTFVQRSFTEPPDAVVTYAGIAVLKGHAVDRGGTSHFRLETLDDTVEHTALIVAFLLTRKQTQGGGVISGLTGQRRPFTLGKQFDVIKYNAFRQMYSECHEAVRAGGDPVPREVPADTESRRFHAAVVDLLNSPNPPTPVPTPLRWVMRNLVVGDVVAWDDRIPYRFVCEHPTERGHFVTPHSSGWEGDPLICAELSYLRIEGLSSQQIVDDTCAFVTGTASSHPVRDVSFTSKHGNRFETQVVRLMTAGGRRYDSPFCVQGDYWAPIDNPLLFALRGVFRRAGSFYWDDYRRCRK